VLLIAFSQQSANAQPTAQNAASPFLTTQWTTENGLPQNTVVAIAQTPDGYLWLATFGGLARFDGLKFTIFNTGNTPALKSNRITALHLGRSGVLWIGAETGEVARFHHGDFSFFSHLAVGNANDRIVRSIYEDRTGAIWVGAGSNGVTRFVAGDPARAEFYDARQGLSQGTVSHLCEDQDGNLWAATISGLALFHETQFTISLKFGEGNSQPLLQIYPHSEGGLWLLTPVSLSRFYQGRLALSLTFPLNKNLAAGLAEGKDKDLLLSYSMDRIYRLKNGVATESKLGRAPVYGVHSLLEDREGNVWLGTIGKGLIRVQRRRVTNFTAADGLPGGGGGPILEGSHGDIWIGMPDGLCHLSGGRMTNYFVRGATGGEKGWMISALHLNQAGDLWIGKDKGIARYRDGQFTDYPLQEIREVSAMLEDRQGCLWLGTRDGLAQFRDGKVTMYSQRDGLVNNDVKFILEDRAGALWLGTPGGLSRFQNGVFTNYTTAEGLSNNYVRAIYEDRDGALWLGTYGGGLNRLQNGRFTQITAKDGLFDDFVSRILIDGNDDFWMLGNRGVFRVSRRVLDDFVAGKSRTITNTVYNGADGMEPSEGNGGFQPAGWRMRDGRFWFPTIGGVAIVDPSQVNLIPPPVVIERVLLNGEELDFRHGVEVLPGKENLEVHYTGLSLGKPELVQFSFKLSGLQEWVDVGQRRAAYFSHLQPGRYTFSVKALSPDGIWSDREATLEFIVRPPFWRTAWFLSLAVMGLAGLVLLGYHQRVAYFRRRNAQQEAFARRLIDSQERERQRIAAELHDGLSQSLVIIKNRALSSLSNPNDTERAMEQLYEIAEASTQAIDEVKEVIHDLRPTQLDRLGLVKAIEDLLIKVADAHDLKAFKQLDEIDGLFSKESENSIYRIVQESLNNVAKHAAASKVRVILSRSAESVELTIADDGKGFVTETPPMHSGPKGFGPAGFGPAGFGLTGIAERTRLLGGNSLIESEPGQGTTVFIKLPLNGNHHVN